MKYLLSIYLLFASAYSYALDVPALRDQVTDLAGVVDSSTHQSIVEMLQAFENKTSDQIAILTIPSLEDETLETYTTKVFDAWKLGQKGKDNGILFLIA